MKSLKALDITVIASESISETSKEFTEYNREQMMEGKRSDGGRIQDSPGNPYRSMKYARYKNTLNPKPGLRNPDLFLTGSFQKQMSMKLQNTDITMDSTDAKTSSLLAKYGTGIFGLGDTAHEQYVMEALVPVAESKVEKLTGLVFL